MTRRRGQPIGAYTGSIPGQVTGRIAGNVLTGQWVGTVAGDSGGFVLNFSADAKSFTGTWESEAWILAGGILAGPRSDARTKAAFLIPGLFVTEDE